MKNRLNLCTLTALVLSFSFGTAAADDFERLFIETHPLTEEIAPGVYRIPTETGFRTYGYDEGGRDYLIRKFATLEQNLAINKQHELLSQVAVIRSDLEMAAALVPQKASDSGTLCSTADYELTANAFQSGIWAYTASATAGFWQWGAGPLNPGGPAMLSTFGSIETDSGLILGADSHSESFSLNGFSFVSVEPVSLTHPNLTTCKATIEGLSLISIQNCSVPNFQFISETLRPCG